MRRHGLEQVERACHRERQDDPVRLRQGQCALGGRGGRALVTEFAVRERCQQVCLNDCHVADGRSYPVPDMRRDTRGAEMAGLCASALGPVFFAARLTCGAPGMPAYLIAAMSGH